MNKGGKRANSGRKKIGSVLNTRVDDITIIEIEKNIPGKNRAEKIRNCLSLGLDFKKRPLDTTNSNPNSSTITTFAKSYATVLNILDKKKTNILENMLVLNNLLFECFYISPEYRTTLKSSNHKPGCDRIASILKTTTNLDETSITIISNEMHKYKWSLSSNENEPNTINPQVLGYFFEQIINKKENGAYYTPIDTTEYMCETSVIISICNQFKFKPYLLKKLITLVNISPEIYLRNHQNTSNLQVNSFEDLIAHNVDLVHLFIDTVNSDDFKYKKNICKVFLELTILDPTVGTGAFIIASAKILLKIFDMLSLDQFGLSRKQFIFHIFKNSLYGVDLMADAIIILKFRIQLFLCEQGIIVNETEDVFSNFKCGNTLFDSSQYNKKQLSELYSQFSSCYKSQYEWQEKIKPFEWRNEYPEVFVKEGFSCVIGNPPYLEWSKLTLNHYPTNNYITQSCKNLYAYTFEKSLQLVKPDGFVNLIVPISIISTNRMLPLVNLIKSVCEYSLFSSFGDRPATLFTGVHQKISIVFCSLNPSTSTCRVYTSNYLHWHTNERNDLFKNISYYNASTNQRFDTLYKIGTRDFETIYSKVSSKKHSINRFFSSTPTQYPLYLNMRATFWCKCFKTPQVSREYKCLYFKTQEICDFMYCLFNSSLFYLIWEMTSDCWHIINVIFKIITFEKSTLIDKTSQALSSLSILLERDLEKNKKYIGSKQTEYEYLHKKSKNIIDEIDYTLAKYYGINNSELSLILNYNLKYRMNDEFENYIERK